jgi:putative Ca2+/H+ antiporter (TMEM165/GDT1 family)
VDWQTFMTTFGLLFAAELGDKTQFAVISLASSEKNSLSVFLGASLALILVTLAGVFIGDTLGRWIPRGIMQKGAGIFYLLQKAPS